MKKVDYFDNAGNPICVETYSSGLTENSITFDGRCAEFSDDEKQAIVYGQGDKPFPMPNVDVVDYYFQGVAQNIPVLILGSNFAPVGVVLLLDGYH